MQRLAAGLLPSGLGLLFLCSATTVSSQTHTGSAQTARELRVFDSALVDSAVSPCENFYRFSCNNWFKSNPLPPDQAAYGRFTELFELNRLHLKEILEGASKSDVNRTANEQKIGDEYASCMDAAAINKLGIAPMKPELDRIAALRRPDELPVLLA